MSFTDILVAPLGWIIWFCYKIIPNYGVSLILFALVTRILLSPLSIKQQKSSAEMLRMKPKMDAINKKHGTNKAKAQEELTKMYSEEGYNPLKGCLPMLIQMPILIGLYQIVRNPITHVFQISSTLIAEATNIATKVNPTLVKKLGGQLGAIGVYKSDPEKFASLDASVRTAMDHLSGSFLGFNLTSIPTPTWNYLIILPILSGISSLALSFISQKLNPAANQQQGGSMMMMMLLAPVMSVWISFSVPAGLVLYWTATSIFMILQTLILYKIYNPHKLVAKLEAEAEERKRSGITKKKSAFQVAMDKAKISAAQNAGTTNTTKSEPEEVVSLEGLSKKEADKIRLAEARKRNAEKYGDEYVD